MIPSLMPTYNRAPLTFVSGEGCWLTDTDGRRFLDFGAGIAVNALGHAHPDLVRALGDQARRVWHVSNLYTIPEQAALADALVAASFADAVFFTNSGTESCEAAVKMARRYWYSHGQPDRTTILTFEGAFHGRSAAGMAATGTEKITEGFAPLLPGFTKLPFGDLDAVGGAVDDTVAAIMVEPIQGEGGVRPLPDGMLTELRAICDDTGALLVLDEVQCGMGRTGRLFAHEWDGVRPDIVLTAKGIGGGFPLGAVLATEAAAAPMVAGSHGSTFGGNPLGCAVGLEVLRHVADEGVLSDIRRRGGLLRQTAEAVVTDHPDVFKGVRGSGLMLGLMCHAPPADVAKAAIQAGLLTVPAGDNVLRLLPPLIVSDDEIREAGARLAMAADSLNAADRA